MVHLMEAILNPNMMLMSGASLPTSISSPSSSISSVQTEGHPMIQKDTTFTKIFVGGLPYHTTDKSLREHFERYGQIDEAVVITDRQTGRSRGYGFVTMSDQASADLACKDPNPIIDGRKANVNLAYLGAKPRGNFITSDLLAGLPLAGLRSYASLFPNHFGLHPQFFYPSPYWNPALLPLVHSSLTQAGATSTPLYDYSTAVATAAAAAAAAASYSAPYSVNPMDVYQLSNNSATGNQAGYIAPNYTFPPLSQTLSTGGQVSMSAPFTPATSQVQDSRI